MVGILPQSPSFRDAINVKMSDTTYLYGAVCRREKPRRFFCIRHADKRPKSESADYPQAKGEDENAVGGKNLRNAPMLDRDDGGVAIYAFFAEKPFFPQDKKGGRKRRIPIGGGNVKYAFLLTDFGMNVIMNYHNRLIIVKTGKRWIFMHNQRIFFHNDSLCAQDK